MKTAPFTPTQLAETLRALSLRLTPEHINYTIDAATTKITERSFRERLFTFPWRPWQKYKYLPQPAIYITPIPRYPSPVSPPIYLCRTAFITAHPSFRDQIEKALKETANARIIYAGLNRLSHWPPTARLYTHEQGVTRPVTVKEWIKITDEIGAEPGEMLVASFTRQPSTVPCDPVRCKPKPQRERTLSLGTLRPWPKDKGRTRAPK